MALLQLITCDTCKRDNREAWVGPGQTTPTTCSDCTTAAEEKKLQEHLAELAKLPTEARLRKIESGFTTIPKTILSEKFDTSE